MRASEEQPFLPFLGDIIIRLLTKSAMLDIKRSSNSTVFHGEIITKPSSSSLIRKAKSGGSKISKNANSVQKNSNSSALQKILSTLRVFPASQSAQINCTSEQFLNENNWYEDNRVARLNKAIEFLEVSQRAASTYSLRRNDLAKEYLLKARYREERENFMNSFSIERQNFVDQN